MNPHSLSSCRGVGWAGCQPVGCTGPPTVSRGCELPFHLPVQGGVFCLSLCFVFACAFILMKPWNRFLLPCLSSPPFLYHQFLLREIHMCYFCKRRGNHLNRTNDSVRSGQTPLTCHSHRLNQTTCWCLSHPGPWGHLARLDTLIRFFLTTLETTVCHGKSYHRCAQPFPYPTFIVIQTASVIFKTCPFPWASNNYNNYLPLIRNKFLFPEH